MVRLTHLLLAGALGGTPAMGGPPVTQGQINAAIDKGLDYLLAMQLPDGGFDLAGGWPVGGTALALYTLVKCGLPADHQAVLRAEAYALSREEEKTYTFGCLLLALAAQDGVRHRSAIHALARKLLDWQRPEGLWAYPTGPVDFSNTQYALLGLWAAAKAEFQPPAKALLKAGEAILKHQADYGGWSYRPAGDGHPVTGSMAAAGAGCLGLIAQLLETERRPPAREIAELRGGVSRALRWFAGNFRPDVNPVPPGVRNEWGHWLYYYLYGVERLGAFAGTDRFGDHDWYREGAQYLVERQAKGGHWGGYPGSLRDTCFALLFLRRATAPTTDYNPNRVLPGAEKGADFEIRADGQHPVGMWVSRWPQRLRDYYSWEDGELRVAWLRWLAGKEELARLPGSEKEACSGQRTAFAFRHAFAANGAFSLRAEAELVDEGGRRYAVRSNTVKVTVDRILTGELASWREDAGRNLLNPTRAGTSWSVTASSTRPGHEPGYAADHQHGTSWVCAAGDEKAWLEIALEKPVKANRLLLTPAIWVPMEPEAFDLPRQVVVRVNKQRFTAELPPRLAKTAIDLGQTLSVNRIYIIIAQWHPGRRYKGAGGLAEVELQLAEDRK